MKTLALSLFLELSVFKFTLLKAGFSDELDRKIFVDWYFLLLASTGFVFVEVFKEELSF